MSNVLQAVRGMNDILPEENVYWQFFESVCKTTAKQFAYQEIRFPIVESTALFKRTIGEVTDIVEKEMYTFLDRNQDSLTLRPEGTAGCVRAGINHSLFYGNTPRLWYLGPMFRHERPQKGRCRQFHQFGVEAFGLASAAADIEVIAFSHQILKQLGLTEHVTLQINTLGTPEVRETYRQALIHYFEPHVAALDAESLHRLTNNPLRILDSKNPDLQTLIAAAPKLIDYLDTDSLAHFETVKAGLQALNIPYTINSKLVRGLDYYTHTVFEWVTTHLGAQGTVCAGGRYDGLVAQLGGQPTPGVGFAMGLERTILLLQTLEKRSFKTDLYFILTSATWLSGLTLAQKIREALPFLSIETNLTGASFKSQFKRADKIGAQFAVILGEEEMASEIYLLKNLRQGDQQSLNTLALIDALRSWYEQHHG